MIVLALIGIAGLVIGIGFAQNYRGVASRLAARSTRSKQQVGRGVGPTAWFNEGFQTIVYRIYGVLVTIVSAVGLSVLIHA